MLTFHPLLQNQHTVAILRLRVPEQPQPDDFYRAAQLAGAALQLEADGDITLKPNATAAERFRMPDSGIGTHPAFIWGLTGYLRAHGTGRREIVIVEDPLNVDYGASPTWQGTGYIELAEATGAILHAPTLASCVERPVRNPQVTPYRRVSRYAVDPSRALINVPKLKTHNLSITTLCLKNLMGLNYGPERHLCSQAMADMPAGCPDTARTRTEWMDEAAHRRWQEGLALRLADLGQVITPRLNIVEGLVGRDGTGFQQGSNRTLGLVIAGTNLVAVDSVTSYLMGFDPEKLIYLQVAASVGLGSNHLKDLCCYELQGDALVPCPSLEPYKADPPFVVNRMLKSGA